SHAGETRTRAACIRRRLRRVAGAAARRGPRSWRHLSSRTPAVRITVSFGRATTMTWADLETLLSGRDLVRPSDRALPDDGARAIAGVSYDSRRIERDHVFVALTGPHADG